MKSKKWNTTIVAALALAIVLAIGVGPVFAVDEAEFFCDGTGTSTTKCDVFQLDGADTATPNADTCVGTENGCPSEESPVWPADWDALVNPNSFGTTGFTLNPNAGSGAGAGTFTLPWGQVGTFGGVFTSSLVSTGTSLILKSGSKNSGDISTWTVATQSSPPKDAFLAAALAAYVAPPPPSPNGGDTLLYHAATRISPNGSATEGIWFFQQNIQVCASGTALCIDGTTTLAQHTVGDLFLFITYSGSGTATIQAATWQGANGPAGFLGPAPGTIVSCPTANNDVCAITNPSAITLGTPTGPQQPGTGFNVSGPGFAGFPGGVVPALQFQEGGIDLSSILGGAPPCFSSVMFATVSSGSSPSSASLKAIVLGTFNTCAISVTKLCGTGTPNITSNTITYPISGTVMNIGGGTVQTLTLTDTFNGSPQAFDSGSLSCTCGSKCTGGPTCSSVGLSPGGTVNYSATITTSNNGGSDVVTATMGGTGGGSATAQSLTVMCQPRTFSDSIAITKNCGIPAGIPGGPSLGASLVALSGLVAVEVGVSGTVMNSSSNLPLSNVTEFECVNGTFAMLTPAANGCFTVPANYTATCAANGGTLRTPTNPTPSTLAAGGSAAWSDSYLPSVAPSCGPYNFNDQVLVLAQCTSQFCACPTVVNVANATCPLCPGPTCP